MDFLERIQSKPSNVKTQYAFGVASAITVIIAIVWMSTIPARFSEVSLKQTDSKEEKANLGDLVNDTKNQLGNVIGSVENLSDTPSEPTNMDAINMEAPATQEIVPSAIGGGGEIVQRAVPTTTPVQENIPPPTPTTTEVTAPVVEDTPQNPPRVILIGTSTTSH